MKVWAARATGSGVFHIVRREDSTAVCGYYDLSKSRMTAAATVPQQAWCTRLACYRLFQRATGQVGNVEEHEVAQLRRVAAAAEHWAKVRDAFVTSPFGESDPPRTTHAQLVEAERALLDAVRRRG